MENTEYKHNRTVLTHAHYNTIANLIMISWALVGLGVWAGTGSFGFGLAAFALTIIVSLTSFLFMS
jgi:hypothetical protein